MNKLKNVEMVCIIIHVLCAILPHVMEFTDAWPEGDGERVLMSCWRFFLLHFYSGGRTKYALEALLLQFQISTVA